MRGWVLGIVAVVVLLLLGAGIYLFVGRQPATPPTPTAVPTPAASPTPEAPGGTASAALVEMTFPAGWQYVVDEWPADAGMESPHVTPQVMAWRDGATFVTSPVRLSIMSFPWNQLPLEQYVADLEKQLNESPGVGDIVTEVSTELRQDGLPAGKVTYTIETDAGAFNGVQVVMIDPPAQNFVVSSLVSPAAAGSLDGLLQELMQTVRLKE